MFIEVNDETGEIVNPGTITIVKDGDKARIFRSFHTTEALCNAADNSVCMASTPQQKMLNKQAILANLQRQLQQKAAEVEKLHRAVTILTLHPEFDMFLELNHLLDGIKL